MNVRRVGKIFVVVRIMMAVLFCYDQRLYVLTAFQHLPLKKPIVCSVMSRVANFFIFLYY